MTVEGMRLAEPGVFNSLKRVTRIVAPVRKSGRCGGSVRGRFSVRAHCLLRLEVRREVPALGGRVFKATPRDPFQGSAPKWHRRAGSPALMEILFCSLAS